MMHCYPKVPHRTRMKVPKVVTRLRYRGCDIEVIDNRFYGFRYEWNITPLSSVAKKCLRRYRMKTMHDPTSSRDAYWCLDRAKEAVNEISAPFWCSPWKYQLEN